MFSKSCLVSLREGADFIYRFADSFKSCLVSPVNVQILVHRAADSFRILPFVSLREGVQAALSTVSRILMILRYFAKTPADASQNLPS